MRRGLLRGQTIAARRTMRFGLLEPARAEGPLATLLQRPLLHGQWTIAGLPEDQVVVQMFLVQMRDALQGVLNTTQRGGDQETWTIEGRDASPDVQLTFTPSTPEREGFAFKGRIEEGGHVVSGELSGAFQGAAKLISNTTTRGKPTLNGPRSISGLPETWSSVSFFLVQMNTYVTGTLNVLRNGVSENYSVVGNNLCPDVKLVFSAFDPAATFTFTGTIDETGDLEGELGGALSGPARITQQGPSTPFQAPILDGSWSLSGLPETCSEVKLALHQHHREVNGELSMILGNTPLRLQIVGSIRLALGPPPETGAPPGHPRPNMHHAVHLRFLSEGVIQFELQGAFTPDGNRVIGTFKGALTGPCMLESNKATRAPA